MLSRAAWMLCVSCILFCLPGLVVKGGEIIGDVVQVVKQSYVVAWDCEGLNAVLCDWDCDGRGLCFECSNPGREL
jgi:hypothetical protein